MQSIVRSLDPVLPIYDVRTMDGVVHAHMGRLSFTIILLGGAAVITLLFVLRDRVLSWQKGTLKW